MLKHLRWPNLLLMALLMFSMRYFLMAPIIQSHDLHLLLSHWSYAGLVLSCVLVAAGGYLINDYYDQEADHVNKPQKVLENPEKALNWYAILSVSGIALGALIGWQAGLLNLAIIHIIVTFLLWKYAESWKGIALLGHMVVAAFLAILVFVPILYEYIAISVLYREAAASARYLLYAGLAYATFAYLATLVRELAKAVEDIHGDQAAGYRTLPIKYGIPFTRTLAVIIQLVTLMLLLVFLVMQLQAKSWYTAAYIFLAVLLPGSLALVRLLKSNQLSDFATVSTRMKWFMLGGIGSLAFFYFDLMYL
ncbi:MAG: geranylgeranylglycerol-phosphate geranylgeranyltransferase [Sphingobacteriaceae bacterium]|nr:geranylgeranylglycerol-phosphate geranylgeranyltransferase [Sphingobacteriaceae bacterium]